MARYGVTFDKVASVAEILAENDVNPTVERIRTHLGTGSKNIIAKHLKRWRTQNERSAQSLRTYDPEHVPAELMALMHDFWQNFYHQRMGDEKKPLLSANKANTGIAKNDTPKQGVEANMHPESLHGLNEQMTMIQDYVVGLEAELAESTALQHRLTQRLSAFYGTYATTGFTECHQKDIYNRGKASAEGVAHTKPQEGSENESQGGEPVASADQPAVNASDLADPKLHPMPILSELSAIQAALTRVEQSHSHLEADLDWATRSAFDLASAEADLQQQLRQAKQQLDAHAVREAALTAENSALKDQIDHLRRALAQRQRFIERLEGEVLSFKPAETGMID